MNILKEKEMESQVFGEGITYADGLLYQLTWLSHRGFIYNATTLDVVKEFKFHSTKNEGWGITWDPCRKELVMTDGSQNLHFWDRKTLTKTKVVPVTRMKGYAASQLNEIEWYRGRILANVWFEDVLLVINPETGTVEKEYGTWLVPPPPKKKLLLVLVASFRVGILLLLVTTIIESPRQRQ